MSSHDGWDECPRASVLFFLAFSPRGFLGSLWGLWPPKNSFQEHNNYQISCCSVELAGQREAEALLQAAVCSQFPGGSQGHTRQNCPPAPLDQASIPQDSLSLLSAWGIRSHTTLLHLPTEIPVMKPKHTLGAPTGKEESLAQFSLCKFIQR